MSNASKSSLGVPTSSVRRWLVAGFHETPNDWAPVALAMVLDAGILTGDHDFLGCGCPTWTVETLRAQLGEG